MIALAEETEKIFIEKYKIHEESYVFSSSGPT